MNKMRTMNLASIENENARKNFYPTPPALADKLMQGIDWNFTQNVLEPSAGKGDLARAAANKIYKARRGFPVYDEHSKREALEQADIDCVEIDSFLRSQLENTGFRVVHDDFLTFETQKRYDLILMNPPFDRGAEHLLHALELIEHGGTIRCILNAETIRNPCTPARQRLLKALETDSSIEYVSGAFADAERSSGVEIAIVHKTVTRKKPDSTIMEDMRKAPTYKTQETPQEYAEIVRYNQIEEWVNRYNYEVACGIRLIEEYEAMIPHILDRPSDIESVFRIAETTQNTRNIDTKYFTVTFFKKGTAHLVFKDMELLEKFNLFAGQKKGWLPPSYGKKKYADMNAEEQHVVDSFQGRERYEYVMSHADYYLDTGAQQSLMLASGMEG